MPADSLAVIERASKAVRIAHDDFRALYTVIDSTTMPRLLLEAGANLDKLSTDFSLLAGFTDASFIGLVLELFQIRISSDTTMCQAIMKDMRIIASRLCSMRLAASLTPLAIVEDAQFSDLAETIKRYTRVISSVLKFHISYVPRINHTIASPR
jgi:hypothetical protein